MDPAWPKDLIESVDRSSAFRLTFDERKNGVAGERDGDALVLILDPNECPLQIRDPISQLRPFSSRTDDLVIELLDLEIGIGELVLLVLDVAL